MDVLNPELYGRLLDKFKTVRVARQGVAMQYRVDRDPVTRRRKIEVTAPGEYYCVCCPDCKDRRHRLWINHRWCTEQEGFRLDYMKVCYNEHCEQTQGFQDRLVSIVFGSAKPPDIQVKAASASSAIQQLPTLNGRFKSFHTLPPIHPAVRYMESREYDQQLLGETWGVQWCEFSIVMPPRNRLFFPLYGMQDNKCVLMGGQSRFFDLVRDTGEPPKDKTSPKWWTYPGTPKADVLYNGWRAQRQHDVVVVCEGPLDVIRMGTECAVGLFGSVASDRQKTALWDNWGAKGALGVLALDPNMYEKKATLELVEWFKGWQHFLFLKLPPDVADVGRLKTHEVWDMINKQLGG